MVYQYMNNTANILTTENLAVGFSSTTILSEINIQLKRASITALLGRNGTGKSTLLRTLPGLQDPISGSISINDKLLNTINAIDRAHYISFVNTRVPLVHHTYLHEIVALGRSPHTGWIGSLNKTDKQIIDDAIALCGLSNLRERESSKLSDGEKQKMMIARAIAQDTDIIILDEPTAFIDLPGKYEIMKILSDLAINKNKSILFSTHDLSLLKETNCKAWVINKEMRIIEIEAGQEQENEIRGLIG